MTTSAHSSRSRVSGFSLVEALIALTMLSVGVLALGGALSATNGAARDSLEATVAEHLVRQKLESLRLLPSADIRDGAETVTLDHVTFTRRWTVRPGTPRPGLTEMVVDVSWSEYSASLARPQSEPVTRALSDPLGSAERLLDQSGRTRRRSVTGFRAN